MSYIYFDLNEYQEKVSSYYKRISEAAHEDTEDLLMELFSFVLKNYEDGIIGLKKLAYDIAGTMQFEITSTGKLKELTELAGELELPDEHITGDRLQKYQHLITLIKTL